MRSQYLLDMLSNMTLLFGKDEGVIINQLLTKSEVSEDEVLALMLYDKYIATLPVDLTRYYTLLEQSETGLLSYAMFVLTTPSTEIMRRLKNDELRAIYKHFTMIVGSAGGLLTVQTLNKTTAAILNNRYTFSSRRIMEECVRTLIKALGEKNDENDDTYLSQLYVEATALIIAYVQVYNYECTVQKAKTSPCH